MIWPLYCVTLAGFALSSRLLWAAGYEIAALSAAIAGCGYLLVGLAYLI